MAAATVNLLIETGVTWERTFVWSDSEGVRRNLTGLSAKMQIREAPGKPVLVELTTAANTIKLQQTEVDGDATGTITVTIPGPLTTSIKKLAAEYDIRLYTTAVTNGEPSYRPIEGAVTFDLGVTV